MVFIQISNRIFNINIHRLTNFTYIYIWNFLLKLHIHRKVFYKIRKKYKSSEFITRSFLIIGFNALTIKNNGFFTQRYDMPEKVILFMTLTTLVLIRTVKLSSF